MSAALVAAAVDFMVANVFPKASDVRVVAMACAKSDMRMGDGECGVGCVDELAGNAVSAVGFSCSNAVNAGDRAGCPVWVFCLYEQLLHE